MYQFERPAISGDTSAFCRHKRKRPLKYRLDSKTDEHGVRMLILLRQLRLKNPQPIH
jgi:hypothetical protein